MLTFAKDFLSFFFFFFVVVVVVVVVVFWGVFRISSKPYDTQINNKLLRNANTTLACNREWV